MGKLTSLVHAGKEAGALMRTQLAKHPSAVSRIGELLKRPGMTIDQIITAAKASPMTTAMVVMELGSLGSELADVVSSVDPDAGAALQSMGFVPDPAPEDGMINLADLSKYADEMAAIKQAALEVGGIQQLIRLRAIMRMDDRFFDMYFQLKDIARSL